jgi:hypothetical protein
MCINREGGKEENDEMEYTADHPGTIDTPNLIISSMPNISEVTVHTFIAKSVKTSHVSHKYGTYN